jgi:hypothetical protein
MPRPPWPGWARIESGPSPGDANGVNLWPIILIFFGPVALAYEMAASSVQPSRPSWARIELSGKKEDS